jgi:predicted DNA-binding transcriptional regulator YafY
MNRQARLLAITEFLRARKTGVTAEQLAERFQVTMRTIYRDLDTLREAELPVLAEQGRGGGYALDRHYTLPPLNLTAREAAVLCALGTHALAMRLIPFPEATQRALEKVRGVLSASAQRELLTSMKQLQFVGVPAHAASRAVTQAIEEAWFTQQPLDLHYRNANGELTKRRVRLLSLVMERTLTLLNCHDEALGEQRQFRLDRIERAEAVAAQAG